LPIDLPNSSTLGGCLSKKVEISRSIRELQGQVAERAVENTAKLLGIEIASKQQRCAAYGESFRWSKSAALIRAWPTCLEAKPGCWFIRSNP
jgi:hypothetical protein